MNIWGECLIQPVILQVLYEEDHAIYAPGYISKKLTCSVYKPELHEVVNLKEEKVYCCIAGSYLITTVIRMDLDEP